MVSFNKGNKGSLVSMYEYKVTSEDTKRKDSVLIEISTQKLRAKD